MNFSTSYTQLYSISTAISLCDLIYNLKSQFHKQLKKICQEHWQRVGVAHKYPGGSLKCQ